MSFKAAGVAAAIHNSCIHLAIIARDSLTMYTVSNAFHTSDEKFLIV